MRYYTIVTDSSCDLPAPLLEKMGIRVVPLAVNLDGKTYFNYPDGRAIGYRPGVTWGDLRQVLPPKITDTLAQAIPLLDRRLHGFALPDAVLTAPETRSSSPVRIIRGQDLQASLAGLYPCGEGAGYAGGIMSAAADGIRCAEALIARQQKSPV